MVQLRFCVLGSIAGSVLRASTTWTCVASRAGRKGAGWECGGARSFSSAAVTMAPIKVTDRFYFSWVQPIASLWVPHGVSDLSSSTFLLVMLSVRPCRCLSVRGHFLSRPLKPTMPLPGIIFKRPNAVSFPTFLKYLFCRLVAFQTLYTLHQSPSPFRVVLDFASSFARAVVPWRPGSVFPTSVSTL